MTRSAPGPRRRFPLTSLNPLVGVLVIAAVAIAMIITLSGWAALIMIIFELPLVVLARMRPRQWAIRVVPLASALVGILIANLLFTDIRSGATLVHLGPIWVTAGGLSAAGQVVLRLLALTIPGIVLFARIDPTDLADALITHWHARPRIAIGALAALRMTPLVLTDLRQSYAARRTRGLIGANPLSAATLFVGTLSAVLVSTVRRATRLSVAMDSRGFDSGVHRTLARRSSWRRIDSLVVTGYFLAATAAVVVGVVTT